jgi:hypothetical protein
MVTLQAARSASKAPKQYSYLIFSAVIPLNDTRSLKSWPSYSSHRVQTCGRNAASVWPVQGILNDSRSIHLHLFLLLLLFGVAGIELRASCLQRRYCTTCPTTPVRFALVILEIGSH